MKIVFVQFECENYAIQLFSSILKQRGHQVYLIFDPRLFNTDEVRNASFARWFDIRKQNIEKIKLIDPDLIGFSVYTQDYQYALSYARMIKEEMDTPIIFGGIHCILCPEEVIKEDCVDIVCVGEGEEALVELLDEDNTNSEIRNLWYKYDGFIKRNGLKPLIQDLDSLPFIDRDILYEQKPVFKRDLIISTGRGCPYQCTFCASNALAEVYRSKNFGKYVRQRSVDSVINELSYCKARYAMHSVYFTDDVFTLSVDWLRRFAFKYKHSIGLPFYCTANPGTIKDEELYLLKQANCQMIGFGMQSCNEEYRKNVLKRSGSNERIIQVADLCHKLGINFSFDHILNLPNEDIRNQDEALLFYKRARPAYLNTFTMTYLPKIELNKYLSEEEREEVDKGKIRTAMFNKQSKLKFLWQLFRKDMKRLIIGRYSDVFFPIKLLLVNMRDNLWIKLKSVL